jgi:cytochrome b involved in lipid metabolism
MKHIVPILLVLTLLFTGCTINSSDTETLGNASETNNANEKNEPATDNTGEEAVTTYTMDEIVLHDNPEDCWLLIDGKVYEVTYFINNHPGGDAILAGCGKDATALFGTKGEKGEPHSSRAEASLENFYIGDLQQ